MRIVLFTGKGGVGKTTVAAGTATLAADRGARTLVLSTDAAHSLVDAFGQPAGAAPTQVAPGLWVQQVDAQQRFERSWADVQKYLLSVLDASGVDPIAAEELTVIPGAEEILALLEVREQVQSGRWDAVIVDCAPTAETLRLLALPEALDWYMSRVLPVERRVVKALRPVLARAAGVPMPRDDVFDAMERLHAELGEVRELLTGAEASVRLVLTPEAVVLSEARRTFTTLALYGYTVDGVVANRLFPDGGADAWRQGWVTSQRSVLAEIEASFAPLPLWRAGFRGGEPVGAQALRELATDLYEGDDPLARPQAEPVLDLTRHGDDLQLSLALPLASRDEVDLSRHGGDLVVTVGSYRRVIALPEQLRRCTVRGARLDAGRLQVRFRREILDEAEPSANGDDR